MTTLERELSQVDFNSQVSLPRRVYRKGRDFAAIVRSLPALSRQTGKSVWSLGRTALILWHRYGFTPKEIRNNGVIQTHNSGQIARTRISKRALVSIQARLNPVELEYLTEDKSAFHALMDAHQLASIPTLAVFFRGFQGRTVTGDLPVNQTQWLAALRRCLPREFVVKPARGTLGAGVRIYRRSSDQLTCLNTGEKSSLTELIDRLSRDDFFSCYLFQERLTNHPAIEALTGSPALQTVRIVTLLGEDNRVEILIARVKLVSGNIYIDNFGTGQSGSMVGEVDLEAGRVYATIHRSENGCLQTVQKHPDTGVKTDGFELPFWPEIRCLVTQAARAFSPVRLLGWDVACTEAGPVIVETNCRWDPPNERSLEALIQRLLEETRDSGKSVVKSQ